MPIALAPGEEIELSLLILSLKNIKLGKNQIVFSLSAFLSLSPLCSLP